MSEVAFPEGFTARTATGGDVDDITAVFAAGELAVNGEVDVDTEDVTTDLRAPLLAEPDHAVVVVEWASDRVVAASILHAGNGDVWANVHPERRGRGIGTSWPPADPPQPGDRPGAVLT
ncbi:MAG TPA: GNAT family N-acetyltransferase, partial [Actinomycetota bacterium]